MRETSIKPYCCVGEARLWGRGRIPSVGAAVEVAIKPELAATNPSAMPIATLQMSSEALPLTPGIVTTSLACHGEVRAAQEDLES